MRNAERILIERSCKGGLISEKVRGRSKERGGKKELVSKKGMEICRTSAAGLKDESDTRS